MYGIPAGKRVPKIYSLVGLGMMDFLVFRGLNYVLSYNYSALFDDTRSSMFCKLLVSQFSRLSKYSVPVPVFRIHHLLMILGVLLRLSLTPLFVR